MKATLTLEIEGSKEEIDAVTKRVQNVISTKRPKVKMKPYGFNPPPTWKKTDNRMW